MWIVRVALRRPYSVVVLAVLVLLFGSLVTVRMNKDIFPTIDIPVVIVVWSYPGLSAQDMERRVVLISERAMSTTVNGISRVELCASVPYRRSRADGPPGRAPPQRPPNGWRTC